jgi:hypothetical protein
MGLLEKDASGDKKSAVRRFSNGILTGGMDNNLAKKEILEQKLPFIIHRRLPNGVSEYWSATELSLIW